MKRILVLGAGQSAPYLISHLLGAADADLEVLVGDRDLRLAEERIGGHPRGLALAIDASDEAELLNVIRASDVVVNFLAPRFQVPVGRLCLETGRSMVSASYRAPELLALESAARSRGVVLASELGLDPGLDHMSAMQLLARIRTRGGAVRRFVSYGSGVVDRSTVDNPLGYAITWNPRNVVTAGAAGARFRDRGQLQRVGYPGVFERTWPVDIPGVGRMEAYPNRDALAYVSSYGLESANTVIRATLRHLGFCETWSAIARLGLTDDRPLVPDLAKLRWRELVDIFVPAGQKPLEDRLAMHLGLHRTGRALENILWLGLCSDARVGDLSPESAEARTPAEAIIELLKHRIPLPPGGRDLVILHHHLDAQYSEGLRRHTSTLVTRGDPQGHTAMAKTVGLPAALAALDILAGTFGASGCPIPVEPAVYERLLPQVEASGVHFVEHEAMES